MHIAIPAALAQNVRALAGEAGARWLEKLPSVVEEIEEQWAISVNEPYVNGEYNFVARAETHGAVQCVVKVVPPRSDRDHFSEAKYLSVSDGNGAVRLLAHDRERMAMLIERANPGETLTQTFQGRERDAVRPAIDLLRATSRKIPEDRTDIILLDDWFEGLRRFERTAFPSSYATKALEIYDRRNKETELIGYLHGDFHPDNIVSADRADFLLIDPKGIIGHIGYEIAVFLNNFHWWQDEEPDIRERLASAIDQFSHAFGLTETELREWAFAQMVLGAWWMFDEMPDIYDSDVAKADIWAV
ncbi:MAG: aminoglycoside phosphotransferase family protein [Pyrinomonadaceae bacterium]